MTVTSKRSRGIISKMISNLQAENTMYNPQTIKLSGKNSIIKLQSSTYTLTSSKDGLHAENTDDTSKKEFVYIADDRCKLITKE